MDVRNTSKLMVQNPNFVVDSMFAKLLSLKLLETAVSAQVDNTLRQIFLFLPKISK